MKSLEQVLMENYADFDPILFPLVQNDGDGEYFRRDLWPAELGVAPTQQQLNTWINE